MFIFIYLISLTLWVKQGLKDAKVLLQKFEGIIFRFIREYLPVFLRVTTSVDLGHSG